MRMNIVTVDMHSIPYLLLGDVQETNSHTMGKKDQFSRIEDSMLK